MADTGYKGQANPVDQGGRFNAYDFIVTQLLNQCDHITLVKIVSCTNSGGLSPVGFVDVQPLVNLVDGSGQAQEHGTIYHLPYFRLQGGGNAVIIDPQVGDIGIAAFADRDISSVKANKKTANPGSARRFDMSDGLYIGGVLNGTPTQYVRFSSTGIEICSPAELRITAPNIILTGNVATIGTLTNNTVNVGSTHTHSNVEPGGGTSGGPQ